MKKLLIIGTILTLGNVSSIAQVTYAKLQDFLLQGGGITTFSPKFPNEIRSFYQALGFTTAWVQEKDRVNCNSLLNLLKYSYNRGLDPRHYDVDLIDSLCKNSIVMRDSKDSILMDARITDAAIHYYHDIAFGNITPQLGFHGLNYIPGCYNIAALVAEYVSRRSLWQLVNILTPTLPEIEALEKKITRLQAIVSENGFKEVTISSKNVDAKNEHLIIKLYQLGILDSIKGSCTVGQLSKGVQEAQRQFILLADGVLRSTIIEQLNVPIRIRLNQLQLSINYYRWLHCLNQNQEVIVVNIPAAYMKVYFDGRSILEMKMVLGQRSTPTPTLSSKVNRVVLYPYWHVPRSIATKEILPLLKINPSYIDAGNFQVLNKSGKVMDPYSINWNELSTTNFPYTLRQSTGCDNALGLLKLDFDSPYGVYLHDTPYKNGFLLTRRYLSHGCLRMEKPLDLGHLVLKYHPLAIDSLEQRGCLRNQSPIVVPADVQIPVIVWYNPAGIDSTGRVLYFEDVYRKFTWTKKQ